MVVISTPLTCCLLVISFAVAQMEKQNSASRTPATFDLNSTQLASMRALSNSTIPETVILNSTEVTRHNFTVKLESGRAAKLSATTNSTKHSQTSQSAATSPKTTTPRIQTPTVSKLITHAIHTEMGYISRPNSSDFPTENSPHIGSITTTGNRTTPGLHLSMSEKNMTINFGFVLGVLGVAVVMIMFDKCKHKFQFLHQPLNSTVDDDTLVISGGLYDGHPIFDNVPPASVDLSQFHLGHRH